LFYPERAVNTLDGQIYIGSNDACVKYMDDGGRDTSLHGTWVAQDFVLREQNESIGHIGTLLSPWLAESR
jgi:hypothetical protein